MNSKIICTIEDKPEIKNLCESLQSYDDLCREIVKQTDDLLDSIKKNTNENIKSVQVKKDYFIKKLEDLLKEKSLIPEDYDEEKMDLSFSIECNAIKMTPVEDENKENSSEKREVPPFIQTLMAMAQEAKKHQK